MQLLNTPEQAALWLRERVSGTLRSDSRAIQTGDGFLAWPGTAQDARRYVDSALAQGAAACIVEQTGVERYDFNSDLVAALGGLKAAAGPLAAAFFGQPSRQLDLLAVTGTNGKTSSAWWLAQALSNLKLAAPVPCAFVGTLGMGLVPDVQSTGLTTPDPVALHAALRRFVDAGVRACAIEASSIGLQEHRLDGCRIRVAIFTNLTQDHLDYHGSMAAYGQSKAALFAWPELQAAVVNIDDPFGAQLVAQGVQGGAVALSADVWTVSCTSAARLQACKLRYEGGGLCFEVREGTQSHTLRTHLIGTYNAANLLGVLAAMRALGVPLAAAVQSCAELLPVPGRLQCVDLPGQPLAVVDYAHTPDALEQALRALRPLAAQRGGRLACLFGCGGDRDRSKRAPMGAVAERHADHLVLTSDNPRSEDAQDIIGQIAQGLSAAAAYHIEPDRARAIARALAQADARDVVLIAGKGHEDYQEIAGQRRAFSDVQQAQQALHQRAAEPARRERLDG